MNKLLELAINKLAHDWSQLNWDLRDVHLKGVPDKCHSGRAIPMTIL